VLTVANTPSHVDIYSITGAHVLSSDDSQIDVSALHGLYILTITNPSGRKAAKIRLR
jgi:hypothetical protein